MKRRAGIYLGSMLLAAVLTTGCGGRGSSSGVIAPAPTVPRGTLRISGVTYRTFVAVDGQQVPLASGTVTVDVIEGVHHITAERAGYTLQNPDGLDAVTVTVNTVTDAALSFARDSIPLPAEWILDSSARIAGLSGEESAPPPLP